MTNKELGSAEVEKTRKRKNLEDLTISDNFVFTRVMQDKDICKKFLSILMGYDDEDVEFLETEKTLDVIYDSKSIRMDVYIKSKDKVINIEMQVSTEVDLANRCRFYRSIIDMDCLSKGVDYKELPESYIIFICRFDPYNCGFYKYEFSNYDPVSDIYLGDKSKIIIYNANMAELSSNKDEKDLLNFICEKDVSNDFINALESKVELVKNNDIWKREYMFLTAEFSDERSRGKAEGKADGIEIGRADGIEIGRADGIEEIILNIFETEKDIKKISKLTTIEEAKIIEILKKKDLIK